VRKASPLGIALAALVVALAAWFGFDLEALMGSTAVSSVAPPAAEPPPAPVKPRPPAGDRAGPRPVPAGDFDYYVLALSWSPSFCEFEATERDKLQCGGARPFHFVVHGLWPQREGGYPQDCPTDAPRVADALMDEMLDIMPSRGLIGHEWRSHGACSGLGQEDYFAQMRAAYEAVDIPDRFEELEQAVTIAPAEIAREFLEANRGKLTPDAIVVTCGGGTRLDGVRLCMDKELRFRPCGQQSQRSQCRRDRVRMPPVRGGTNQ
jgi:ribonuclease T2